MICVREGDAERHSCFPVLSIASIPVTILYFSVMNRPLTIKGGQAFARLMCVLQAKR